MSRFVRQSQLRNLVVEQYPAEKCFSEIRAGDVQSRGDLVACSVEYAAFVSSNNSNNAIGVVDTNAPGKQHNFTNESCQQGGVYDLKFSPHAPNILASGAGNGSVVVWNISGNESSIEMTPGVNMSSSGNERIQSMQWNPSAKNILSMVSGEEIAIWDVEHAESPLYNINIESPTMDSCWGPTGEILLCLNEDKSIKVVDPRQKTISAVVANAHQGSRQLGRIVSGGASAHGELEPYFYSTGLSMARDRELAAWDIRNLSGGAVVRQKVTSGGTGLLIPIMVPDMKILLLVAKGESSIRAFEPTSSSPFVFSLSQTTTSAEPFLGVAALPVGACDYMSCEVSRLYKLTANSLDTIRVEIPRKLKQTFHEDLFPQTVDVLHSALSASEWCEGESAKQPCVDYRTLAAQIRGEATTQVVQTMDGKQEVLGKDLPSDGTRNTSPTLESEETSLDTPEEFQPSDMDKRMSKMMGYVPKFKYARSVPVPKDSTVFNMKVGTNPCLAVSTTRYATPWQGGGGPIFVGSLSQTGKIDAPEQVPLLNEHSRPVFCLEFDPFDGNVLLSGADDCHIRAWRLNDDDLASSSSQLLSGHQSAVRILRCHPSAKGLFASASQDCTVRLWDVSQGAEVSTLFSSSETFTSIDWNYNGSAMVLMNRLNEMSIVDSRSGSILSVNEKAHAGAKPCNVCWLGESPNILSSGCARMGYREISIWDSRKVSSALYTHKIDTGATAFEPLYVEDNGVVILVARGENTFHLFEIEDLMRTSKPEYSGENPCKPHKCSNFIAQGETTSAVAMLPRRLVDVSKTEFARVYRLTPTTLDPISFTIPRSKDLAEYFADDVYCDTRSGDSAVAASAWLDGVDANPVLTSLNFTSQTRLSERDPSLAHASLKRAQENTLRFRKQMEEEEARVRRQEEAFARMQRLAIQHEEYNPNLSMGGRGHNEARKLGQNDLQQASNAEPDVDDDEWDD